MQNRRDRTSDTNRIKGKSLSISFFIHCVGIIVLFTSPWDRTSATTYEVFTVQVIDIPEMEIPKEFLPKIEKQETIPIVPRKVKHSVKPGTSSAERTPAFSAEKFREKLSAKIEVSQQKEADNNKNYEKNPVKIEKIESPPTEVNITSLNLTVPQWYISLVQSRIKKNWETYNILGSRSTTVSFRIFRDGRIDNIALEKSSGNSRFDRSVINAVKETKNLPHFPVEIPEAHLDIVIDFKTEG
jgi:TonB family protein